jgi:hypothetical protein
MSRCIRSCQGWPLARRLRQLALGLTLLGLAIPAMAALRYAGGAGSGLYQDLVTVGGYAYAATCAGLDILDLREPSHPLLVGQHHTPGCAQAVAVSGHTAALADGDHGLVLVDVADPTAPTLLGHFATAGTAVDVAAVGALAYVVNAADGLEIVDFSDPALPVLRGVVSVPGLQQVAMVGTLAYLAAGGSGLQILDLTDPAAPRPLGSYLPPAVDPDGGGRYVRSVTVAGHLAYLLTPYELRILDVADPTAPHQIGGLAKPPELEWAYRFDLSGEQGTLRGFMPPMYHFLPGYHYLVVLDLQDPRAPLEVAQLNLDSSGDGEPAATLRGTPFFLPDGYSGLRVFDLAGADTRQIGTHLTGWGATDIALAGELAVVVDSASRLDLFDLREPTRPRLVGSYLDTDPMNWYNGYYAVAAEGDIACLLEGYATPQTLRLLDLSDPQQPRPIGEIYDGIYGVHSLALADHILYVSFHDGYAPRGSRWNTSLFDLHDPAAPRFLTTYPKGIRLAVEGRYAYLATGKGVEAVDISDPSHPQPLGQVQIAGALDVALADGLVHVLSAERLHVLQPSADRRYFKRLGAIAVPGPADRVTAGGGVVYVTTGYGEDGSQRGVYRFDVGNPAQPRLLDSYPLNSSANGMLLVDDALYLATSENHLLALAGDPVIAPPAPPAGLAKVAVTAGAVQLIWEDRSDNEDGFLLERAVGKGAWAPLASLPADSPGFTDTQVTPGKLHRYRVQAFNDSGVSGYSKTLKVSVPKATSP